MDLKRLLKILKQKVYTESIECGFTLIEVMVSMGLLAFVMAISMNVLSIVLEMTDDADFSVVITQESEYGVESIKRVVRSADSFTVSPDNTALTAVMDGISYVFQFTVNTTVSPGNTVYNLTKMVGKNRSSVTSSEVYMTRVGSVPFFEITTDSAGNKIGVQMAFEMYHVNDQNKSAGSIMYTQAIGRNVTLNW